MKIFVISMKNAAERRASAVEQFEQANLEFRFFDAIEGVDCIPEYFSGINRILYRLNTLREPLAGEIGCYASHLALWKICAETNEPILILEDDFQLTAEFPKAFPVIKTLADTYGFIRLQTFARQRRLFEKLWSDAYQLLSYQGLKLYYLSDVPLCTLAYAISPVAATSLIKSSTTLIAPVDKFLQQTWAHNTPIYALSPAMVGVSICTASSTIGIRQRKSLNPGLLVGRAIYKGLAELFRISFVRRHLSGLRSRYLPISRSLLGRNW